MVKRCVICSRYFGASAPGRLTCSDVCFVRACYPQRRLSPAARKAANKRRWSANKQRWSANNPGAVALAQYRFRFRKQCGGEIPPGLEEMAMEVYALKRDLKLGR